MDTFGLNYLLPLLSSISIFLVYVGYKALTISKGTKNIEKQTTEIQAGLEKIWDVFDHKSVFGKRILHFRYEKELLAKRAIDKIESYLHKNPNTFYCLLIDSGTTMFPLFYEITKRIHDKDTMLNRNLKRIVIVTNNIPGIFHMMKYGKERPEDDYSEIMLKCYMVPGKPLSVYAATTGIDACDYIAKLNKTIQRDFCKIDEECDAKIIGFITGNYMCKHNSKGLPFVPVARGEGHLDIKNTIAEISNELFFISPLMKFSFADINLLNSVNKHNIDIEDISSALKYPKKVKYREVTIPKNKKCIFFTTFRKEGNLFKGFSDEFMKKLNEYKDSTPDLFEIDVSELDPRFGSSEKISDKNELEIEIPHKELRDRFSDGKQIWNKKWCLRQGNNTIEMDF